MSIHTNTRPSPLQTPHSGYHWRRYASGAADRFFEGWYFRITLPAIAQSFAFMYSIDDPAGGSDYSGGAAQILGPDETYYCRTFPDVTQFWAWPHRLGLGHWRQATGGGKPRYLPAESFEQTVKEGYQVSDRHHQGKLLHPSGKVAAQWDYHITPLAGWGAPNQRATAGWLSYFPVFEPGWQVLMAHGLASGQITWRGKPYSFTDAPAYAEKNWGGAFPAKWFWMQCNAFAAEPTLSVTAAGGRREVFSHIENVGLIGIHYQGQFYEFISTKQPFTWQVDPWGYWHLSARSDRYRVALTGRCTDEADAGAWVRVPTRTGLQWLCRDTTHGELRLQMWQRQGARAEWLVVDTTSQLAGLEVGGEPWKERWDCEQASPSVHYKS